MIQMSHMISMRKFRFFPMRFPKKTPFGGFLFCHGGTPSSHPFFESDCPWNQPSICGYPLFTDQFANWKITIFKLGKSTIFYGPFSNSYVKLPEPHVFWRWHFHDIPNKATIYCSSHRETPKKNLAHLQPPSRQRSDHRCQAPSGGLRKWGTRWGTLQGGTPKIDRLVVLTILKNMSSSMGRMTSHIWNGK